MKPLVIALDTYTSDEYMSHGI